MSLVAKSNHNKFNNKYDGDVFPLLTETIFTQHEADISEHSLVKLKIELIYENLNKGDIQYLSMVKLREDLVYQTRYISDLKEKIVKDHEFLLKTPCKGTLETSVEAALNAAYDDHLQWLAEFIADMCSSS